jgi:hypothetical protein
MSFQPLNSEEGCLLYNLKQIYVEIIAKHTFQIQDLLKRFSKFVKFIFQFKESCLIGLNLHIHNY